MRYKVEFELECTTATTKDIKEGLTFLLFPDIDDVVSYPIRLKVKQLNKQ